MEDEARELAEKKAFFDILDALDQEDEDSDPGIKASMQAMMHAPVLQAAAAREASVARTPGTRNVVDFDSKSASSTHTKNSVPGRIATTNLERSHTLPDRGTAATSEDDVMVVKDTPLQSTLKPSVPPSLRHSVSVPSTISSSAIRMGGVTTKAGAKRKRSDALQTVPETQRVFAGLQLYFFPNNNVAKARRMKIDKAIQYGANWAKEWSEEVTHIIVDKDLSYKDVMKTIGLSELPRGVILVNDEYPADCIAWKMLVDPTLHRFAVKGKPLLSAKVSSPPLPAPSESSQISLQIKPVKRKNDMVVYDVRTQSRTDEDSLELLRRQSELEQDGQGVVHAEKSFMSPKDPSKSHGKPRQVDSTPDRPLPVSKEEQLIQTTYVHPTPIDTLQEAIAKTKAVEHLPMDSDDEETSPQPSADNSDSESNSSSVAPKPAPKKAKPPQAKFACMSANPTTTTVSPSTNPNSKTIQILQEMADYYSSTLDHWRTIAYRKAITQLRNQPNRIATKEEAEALPYVGARLAAKIEEIVVTNRLRRLDSTKQDPADQTLALFAQIYGVGHVQASRWVQQGFKTLDDLLARARLTENQKLGIMHFEDFRVRIPRADVERLAAFVRREMQRIDKGIEITIGGSYRRGAADSGDVDLVITKPGASATDLKTIVLDTAVPHLFAQNFLTAALSASSKDDGSKWHGACHFPPFTLPTPQHPNPWRRIDLLLVPWDEMGAAIIYFTGNDIFNRSMRLLARTKGMRLNQRGLYRDVVRRKGGLKFTEGVRVAGADEREIFEVLGVPWREKEGRNC